MSTVIRRTNPNRIVDTGSVTYRCSVCGRKWNTFDHGKTCAEKDFAKRDRDERNARRRVARQRLKDFAS